MCEDFRATIKVQRSSWINQDDTDCEHPFVANVLHGEVRGFWIGADGVYIDNLWRQPKEGYIVVKIGEVVTLRLSGAEAVQLACNFSLQEPPTGLPPSAFDGYWEFAWMIESEGLSIHISDATANEIQETLAWLTEKHPY